MEIGTEISQKIRSAIKAKLIELGAYVDDELPDYIMVMVANKRSQKQMTDDLSLFLSTNTEKFTTWLHGLLKKLQSINTDQVQSKPKHKEKHKAEKKKHRTSTSEKTNKSETDKATSSDTKEEQKKQKIENTDSESKVSEKITSTVKSGEDEPATEINISENTDEFNEENRAVETVEAVKAKKSQSGKISKTAKSSDVKKSAAKTQPQDKSTSGQTTDKETKKGVRKKPSSFVASVKRKYEEEEEEEEYDPLNPAVGNVASVIRGPTRKSSIPKAMQANRSLLMKAVNDAERSVTTVKRTEVLHTDSSSGMKSDQRPVDLRKRLKTAAGLQLLSRSKRKGVEDMTYTIENDIKKPRKAVEDFTQLKYTVKNVQASKSSDRKKSRVALAGQSRLAGSALKAITQTDETRKIQHKIKEEKVGEVDEEEEDDEGRETTDSEYYSDNSEGSDEVDESDGRENEEEGLQSGEESEAESEEESEYSVEEMEIEVTDRASQTIVNMRESNFGSLGINTLCEQQCQTEITELEGKLSKDKLGEIDSCLFNLFIDNLLPFEFVENEAFKLFTKTLQPKYHFPKRKKLIAELGMMYNVVKDDLKQDLSQTESCVITHNSWTNIASELFDSTSLHYVTCDWVLKRAVIRTSSMDINNLVDNLANYLEETRLKWHLPKLFAVVKDTNTEKSVFEMLDWKTVSCFGHCVQEMVKKCLEKEEVSVYIQRGRELIQEVQDNEQVLDVFDKKKEVLLSPQAQGGKLKLDDGANDWSKTLDMILRLIEQTPALHAAIMDSDLTNQGVDLRSHLYNFNEQSVLESLVKILSPFKTATDILTSAEGLPTIQKVIPTLIKLEKVLEKDVSDTSVIESVKQLMKGQIQKFLKANRKIYLLACLVHPQTKQIGFLSQEDRDFSRALLLEEVKLLCEKEFGKSRKQEERTAKFKKGKKQHQKQTVSMSERIDDQDKRCVVMTERIDESGGDEKEDEAVNEQESDEFESDKQISDETVEDNHDTTDETANKIHREVSVEASTSNTATTGEEVSNLSITVENDWLDDVIRAPEEQKSPEEVAKIELDVYMAEPASNKNPLGWWKEKHSLYPRISKVARRILTIPASSLSSDDVYNLTDQYQMLDIRVKPEHVDMMMFLNKNKHLLQ